MIEDNSPCAGVSLHTQNSRLHETKEETVGGANANFLPPAKHLPLLAKRGISVHLENGEPVLSPAKLVTDKMRETAAAHRSELVAELYAQARAWARLLERELNRFGYASFFSGVLGQTVYIYRTTPPKTFGGKPITAPTYSLDELKAILGMDPEELRTLHAVKQQFGGGVQRELDPRAEDLTDDTALWEKLLRLAEPTEQLFAALVALRALGARLDRVIGGYKLVWDPHADGSSRRQFNEDLQDWVGPHEQTLRRLLRAIDIYKEAA